MWVMKMSINEILTKTGMTKYRLAKLSGVPHAIKITIMNRTEGTIDMTVLKFGDILGLKNGASPYYWDEGSCNGWYGFKMTGEEYDQISDTVHDYGDRKNQNRKRR